MKKEDICPFILKDTKEINWLITMWQYTTKHNINNESIDNFRTKSDHYQDVVTDRSPGGWGG